MELRGPVAERLNCFETKSVFQYTAEDIFKCSSVF